MHLCNALKSNVLMKKILSCKSEISAFLARKIQWNFTCWDEQRKCQNGPEDGLGSSKTSKKIWNHEHAFWAFFLLLQHLFVPLPVDKFCLHEPAAVAGVVLVGAGILQEPLQALFALPLLSAVWKLRAAQNGNALQKIVPNSQILHFQA